MNFKDDYLRLPTNPVPATPPQGYRDIRWDSTLGSFVVKAPDGTETPIGGGGGASSALVAGLIDVTQAPYFAKGDAQMRVDGAITSGSTTFASATANFSASDVGPTKMIRIEGAGVAGADLITYIASRTNSTTVTLATAAGTTVSAKSFWWGTDDTDAIQGAIDDATVMVPRPAILLGMDAERAAFLCNLTLPREMKIVGFNGGTALGNLTTDPGLGRYSDPTWVCALMPAVSSSPVIYAPDAFGVTLERMCLVGGAGKVGKGLAIGPAVSNTFGGLGITLDRVMITGFDECIRNIFCNQVNIIGGNWLDSNKGIWFGKDVASGWGGVSIHGIQTVRVDDVFTGAAGTGIRVFGTDGDFNYGVRIAKVESTGMFTWQNINIEDFTGCVVEITSGSSNSMVDISGINRLRSDIPIVKNSGGSTYVNINGNGGIYRTNGTEYPNFLDRTMVIERYNSDYTTLMEQEWAAQIYRTSAMESQRREYSENWMRMPLDTNTGYSATNGIGSLGWQRTLIAGGSNIAWRTEPGDAWGQAGALSWQSNGSALAGSASRLALSYPLGPIGANQWQYEFAFLSQSTVSYTKFRYGLYNCDTATMTPTDGIGLYYDPGVSAFLQLEIRAGSASRFFPTTYTAMDMMGPPGVGIRVKIQKRSGGIYMTLRNHATGAILAPQVSTVGAEPSVPLPSAKVSMAFMNEMTGTNGYVTHFYPNILLKFLDSY